MIIRHTKNTDVKKMYDAFKSVSFSKEDFEKGYIPKSGFYDYSLTYPDFSQRVDSPLSLICENRGELFSYVVAFSIGKVRELIEKGTSDPVLNKLERFDGRLIYVDQFYLKPGLPIQIGANLFDKLTSEAEKKGSPGLIGVISEKPWKNKNSIRFALSHGFSRKGTIKKQNSTLGVFVKPIIMLNSPFKNLTDNLLDSTE